MPSKLDEYTQYQYIIKFSSVLNMVVIAEIIASNPFMQIINMIKKNQKKSKKSKNNDYLCVLKIEICVIRVKNIFL